MNWEQIYNDSDFVRYMCVGEEICPQTGKKHWQGWVQFQSVRRKGGVQNVFGNHKLHVEPKRGTEYQMDLYCKKENKYQSYGEFWQQGARRDLNEIKTLIDKGASKNDVMEKDFSTYCMYRNGINDALAAKEKKDTKDKRSIEVILILGGTEEERTDFVMEKNIHDLFRQNMNNMKRKKLWWDGYDGEKVLFIDNYSYEMGVSPIYDLLLGWQTRLPIKGGHTYAKWNKIIISCDAYPKEIKDDDRFEVNPRWLFRAEERTRRYKTKGEWVKERIPVQKNVDRANTFLRLISGAYINKKFHYSEGFHPNMGDKVQTFTAYRGASEVTLTPEEICDIKAIEYEPIEGLTTQCDNDEKKSEIMSETWEYVDDVDDDDDIQSEQDSESDASSWVKEDNYEQLKAKNVNDKVVKKCKFDSDSDIIVNDDDDEIPTAANTIVRNVGNKFDSGSDFSN